MPISLVPSRRRSSFITRHSDDDGGGRARVSFTGIKTRAVVSKFAMDGYSFVTGLAWRFLIPAFFVVYALSYLAGGLIWYWIALSEPSCLAEVHTFLEAFQLSMETQATVGWGFRLVNLDCASGAVFMYLQVMFGLVLDAVMLSVILVRLARPQQRKFTLIFSDKACVHYRDSKLCLVFRMGDERHNAPFVDGKARLVLVYDETSLEGAQFSYQQKGLALSSSVIDDTLLVVPKELCHVVDERSFLHGKMTPEALIALNAEFVLIFEGIVQSTGLTLYTRTSYTVDEILFGQRFKRINTRSPCGGASVDWRAFNATEPCPVLSPVVNAVPVGNSDDHLVETAFR